MLPLISIRKVTLVLILAIFPISAFATTAPAVSEVSPISKNPVFEEIDVLVKKGDLISAKNKCESLTKTELSTSERKLVQHILGDINIGLLFSPTVTPNSFIYVVKPGDALARIAKKNNTTVDLIKKSNRLKNDVIYEGLKLKIVKTTFHVTVDISTHQLKLYAGDEWMKTYSVATGKPGHDTPPGTVTIVNKLENPVWYHEGKSYKPGEPENILGTRWMGFSLKSYGIHGTTLPDTVGTSASEGCIRMLNQEVEELYTILPIGTSVTLKQ